MFCGGGEFRVFLDLLLELKSERDLISNTKNLYCFHTGLKITIDFCGILKYFVSLANEFSFCFVLNLIILSFKLKKISYKE